MSNAQIESSMGNIFGTLTFPSLVINKLCVFKSLYIEHVIRIALIHSSLCSSLLIWSLFSMWPLRTCAVSVVVHRVAGVFPVLFVALYPKAGSNLSYNLLDSSIGRANHESNIPTVE